MTNGQVILKGYTVTNIKENNGIVSGTIEFMKGRYDSQASFDVEPTGLVRLLNAKDLTDSAKSRLKLKLLELTK